MHGQASFEFIMVLMMYMLLLLAYFIVYQATSDSATDRVAYLYAKTSAELLAAGINGLAMQRSENSTANLTLPRSGISYSLEGRYLKAELGNAVAYSRLLTEDVKLLFNGTVVRLRKADGVVYAEDG